MKGIFVILWTIFVLVVYVVVCVDLTEDYTYTGDGMVKFTTSMDNFSIESNSEVTAMAASPWSFFLRNGDDSLESRNDTQNKPFFWDYDEYHVFDREGILTGEWNMIEGTLVTFILEGEGEITVKVALNSNLVFVIWFAIALVALIVWVFISAQISSIK